MKTKEDEFFTDIARRVEWHEPPFHEVSYTTQTQKLWRYVLEFFPEEKERYREAFIERTKARLNDTGNAQRFDILMKKLYEVVPLPVPPRWGELPKSSQSELKGAFLEVAEDACPDFEKDEKLKKSVHRINGSSYVAISRQVTTEEKAFIAIDAYHSMYHALDDITIGTFPPERCIAVDVFLHPWTHYENGDDLRNKLRIVLSTCVVFLEQILIPLARDFPPEKNE